MDSRELKEDTTILEWFVTTSIKDSTRIKYSEAMLLFLEMAKKTPNELILEAEADIKSGKLMRERTVRNYLLQFKILLENKIKKNELSESTAALRMSAIKSFYRAFDIDLPKNINNGDALPKTENMNLKFGKEDIRKMVLHTSNVRNRAIMLTMKSNGMARKEIINLDYRQFREGYDAKTKVTTIYMRRSKIGFDFVTFIDPEGSEAIIEYLKKENRLTKDNAFDSQFDNMPLFTALRKKKGRLNELSFLHIFRSVAVKMRVYALSKKGAPIKFNPLRSHNLRKFFRKSLLHDGMDDALINYMMGHIPSKVSKAYHQVDVDLNSMDAEDLKQRYMQHMHVLAINSNGSNTDVLKENQKLKAEIERLEAEHLKTENTPDNAITELMNDEAILRKLFDKFEKFKAMNNDSK
jgi:site-specific recombinase XerD